MRAGKKTKRKKKGAKPLPRRELVRKPPPRTGGTGPEWVPVAAADEPLVDAAIVSAKVRQEELDPSLRPAAEAVVKAIEHVAAGEDAAAIGQLSSIPRSSPYAQWRWFVRGLIAHYGGDTQAAEANWAKLDSQRRPARIAAALRLVAHDNHEQPPATDSVRVAARRLADLQRLRPALAAARQLVVSAKRQRPGRGRGGDSPEKLFGPDDVSRLMALRDGYRKLEPKFLREFELACVRTCFFQPYADVFRMMTDRIPGPPHDPRWDLLASLYHNQFQDGSRDAVTYLKRYSETDASKSKGIQRDVVNAIISTVWLKHANELMEKAARRFPFGGRDPADDDKVIEAAFQQAIRAFPANRDAHQTHVAFLTEQLESSGLTAKQRQAIENRIIAARQNWVAGVPDEVEQRIALIDHFLAQDDLGAADTHIGIVAAQRSDNPHVTALPWKLKLRQAMRLAKQKRNLPQAGEALGDAEALWPQWLPMDWLPFLRAALSIRGDDASRGEELLESIRQSGRFPEVTFDALWFGAATQMNLPAEFVRPLRAAIDTHAKNAARLSLDDLVSLGGTFWDLERGGIMYRGFRGHGSKFGKALRDRLKLKSSARGDQRFLDACFWAASHGHWLSQGADKSLAAIKQLSSSKPLADAVLLRGLLTDTYFHYQVQQHTELIERVRELAVKQTDPYYRHYLRSLVDQAEQLQRKAADQRGRFPRWMGFDSGDEYQDDDEDDFEADDLCDCPECRAARGELSAAEIDALDVDQWDEEVWQEALRMAPPPLRRFLETLSRPQQIAFISKMANMSLSNDFSPESFMQFLIGLGAEPSDFIDLLAGGLDPDDALEEDEDDFDMGSVFFASAFSSATARPAEPPMTAAEKRQIRKKRKPPGRSKGKR